MMKVLVVTGGIGSGKSEVCRILRETGITAQYDADTRVKELYHRHPTLLSSIESVLGMKLRDDDGAFLPALMAERILRNSRLHMRGRNMLSSSRQPYWRRISSTGSVTLSYWSMHLLISDLKEHVCVTGLTGMLY